MVAEEKKKKSSCRTVIWRHLLDFLELPPSPSAYTGKRQDALQSAKFTNGNEEAKGEDEDQTEQITKTHDSKSLESPKLATTITMAAKRNWEDIEEDALEGGEEGERQQEEEYTHRHPMARLFEVEASLSEGFEILKQMLKDA